MQLVYLQFDSLAHLKKFTKKFPGKKVFIMLDRQVLLAQLSGKEVELAVEEFQAEVISRPLPVDNCLLTQEQRSKNSNAALLDSCS